MAELTRRRFLNHASIVVTGGALAGGLLARRGLAEVSLWPAETSMAAAMEPVQGLIAHVRNVSTGEIAIMTGTREVIYRDPLLVARLMDVAANSRVR
jgi:hypothetical protein